MQNSNDPIFPIIDEYVRFWQEIGEHNYQDKEWIAARNKADEKLFSTAPTTLAGAKAKVDAILKCEDGTLDGLGEHRLRSILLNIVPTGDAHHGG